MNGIILALVLQLQPAHAFSTGEVIPAEPVKRNVYVSDSLVSGGDAQSDSAYLANVRWAKNPAGYERIVIDLAGEGPDWSTKTPPYFQVGHEGRTNSINVSIRGIVRRNVSTASVERSVAKSALVSEAYLAPSLEGDLAALQFRTRAPVDIESFYLVNPPRIVIDVRAKR